MLNITKRKILHIQVLPKLSGVQKVSYDIFRNLPADKYEKLILFSTDIDTGDKNHCINLFKETGAKVILSKNLHRRISFMDDLRAFIEIYNLCKKYKFDIVHTFSTKPGIIGRIAARIAGISLVVHSVQGISYHKYEAFYKRFFYYFIEIFATFFSHKLLLVNNYYKKHYAIFKKQVEVIYNSIDFERLPVRNADSLNNGTDNIRLLSVGRLDKQKNPLALIETMNILINGYKRKDVKLTMVGDGEYYNECMEKIEKYNLGGSITLAGWQSNVNEYYLNSDIFCATSIYEAFGIMFLEAGYYKLPTVATNVEGIPEVIINGQTGLLVEPQSPEQFAKALIELIDNPSLRIQMGNQSYERVTTQFSSLEIMRKYHDVYSTID